MSGFPASFVGIGSPSGPAGGDLSGTYPNPTVPGLETNAAAIAAEQARAEAAEALLQSIANLSQSVVTDQASTTKYPSVKAVYDFAAIAVAGLMELKGNLDCSTNPNYPAGSVGDTYYVTVAGKIGGASGLNVDIGDAIICKTDNAGGTQASVGSSWFILEHNLQGALLAGNNLSDLTSVATARTNLGLTFSASSDQTQIGNVAGSQAVITGDYTVAVSDFRRVLRVGSGSGTITVPADTLGAALDAGCVGELTIIKIGTGTHALAVSGAGASATRLNGALGDNIQPSTSAVVVVLSTTSVAWSGTGV